MPDIAEVNLAADNRGVVCYIITCASSWSPQINYVIGINCFDSSRHIISKTSQNLSSKRTARTSVRFIHELPESNGRFTGIMPGQVYCVITEREWISIIRLFKIG